MLFEEADVVDRAGGDGEGVLVAIGEVLPEVAEVRIGFDFDKFIDLFKVGGVVLAKELVGMVAGDVEEEGVTADEVDEVVDEVWGEGFIVGEAGSEEGVGFIGGVEAEGEGNEDVEEGGAENFFVGGDIEEGALAGGEIGETVFGGEAAETGEEVGGKLFIGGEKFKFIEKDNDLIFLAVDAVDGTIEGAVGVKTLTEVEGEAGVFGGIEEGGGEGFVDFFGGGAANFLAVDEDEESVWV